MTFLTYKKIISCWTFFFILLTNPIDAEQLLNKSEILKNSNLCFNDFQYEVCSNFFLELEKIQLFESDQERYKCQASILGLQTELIQTQFFKKLKKDKNRIMIPYVIKNC